MLDRRDQLGIKPEFVDECVRRSSNRKRYSRAQALPRRPAVTYARRNGINALDGNTFSQPRIKTEAIALRADERPANRIRASLLCSAQFRAIARGFAAISFRPPGPRRARHGGLNAGVRNSEAFARTRKTRSRELVLRTCSAFLNKLANETPTPLLERGAGKCRWLWEDETSDPRRESKCALCGIQAVP